MPCPIVPIGRCQRDFSLVLFISKKWNLEGHFLAIVSSRTSQLFRFFYYTHSRHRRSWCWNVTVAKSICHLLRSVINCSNWFSCLFCWLLVTLGPYHTVLALVMFEPDFFWFGWVSSLQLFLDFRLWAGGHWADLGNNIALGGRVDLGSGSTHHYQLALLVTSLGSILF